MTTIATTTRASHRGIDALLSERIARTLNEQRHGTDWLAAESGIPSRVLHSRLAGDTEFTVTELGRIASVLGCGWAELAPTGVEL